MFKYLVFLYLVALGLTSTVDPSANEVLRDQELVFAYVVHRHGERAPDSDELSLSDEQEKLINMTATEGLEGLTNMGKRRAYQIGKFIKQRYGCQMHHLISSLYLQEEIAIRSTDKERTKMTVQVAMAAVYPPEPEQQWDEGVGKVWQPVPYTALPLTQDYLRYYSNCERFTTLMNQAKKVSLNEEFVPYLDLVPFLAEKTGRNFTENPLMFETLFDLFRSLVGLGLDIPNWATPLLPRLSEAARLAYRLYFRNDEMRKIGGGVLLDNFMQAADDIISGKNVNKRLRIFSSHDFNIGALMDVTKVKSDQSIPEYGALFSLELYKSRSKGTYSVLPVYLPQAGESSAKALRFSACENKSYCDYSHFKESTKQFRLSEREYNVLCNIKV